MGFYAKIGARTHPPIIHVHLLENANPSMCMRVTVWPIYSAETKKDGGT